MCVCERLCQRAGGSVAPSLQKGALTRAQHLKSRAAKKKTHPDHLLGILVSFVLEYKYLVLLQWCDELCLWLQLLSAMIEIRASVEIPGAVSDSERY